jgi:secretion/DNA translocation related CpaE-like protein
MPDPTALLVTRDDVLLEDLLRLAAAAGVALDVAHDADTAVRTWSTAPVVLVGCDQVAALAARRPVRRGEVHVVAGQAIPDALFRAALEIGAVDVVELPAGETWLVEMLTDVADGGARRAAMIGVVGGSGGVGATTFAAALAVTAATGSRPGLLVDADPLGGGIDRVVGMEEVPGVRWDSLVGATGRFGSRSLRDALPRRDGLAVLTWASGLHRTCDDHAVREVLSAAQRGNDTVVVDLPRYPDRLTTEVVSRCDHVVLVTGLAVPAVAAAGQVAGHLRERAHRLHLVARIGTPALGPEEVARALGVPLAATMADQRRLTEAVDLGLGPVRARRGPLARAAREVLHRLGAPPSRAA